MTQKGQVTIPADMRKALGLKAGSKVRFTLQGRRVMLEAVAEPSVSSVFGAFKAQKGRGIRDIDAALEELRHERYSWAGKPKKHK
jgi:AbrB family looped-hinge helix DNA binding protein